MKIGSKPLNAVFALLLTGLTLYGCNSLELEPISDESTFSGESTSGMVDLSRSGSPQNVSLPYPTRDSFVPYSNNENASPGDSSYRVFRVENARSLRLTITYQTERCCDDLIVRDMQSDFIVFSDSSSEVETTHVVINSDHFSIGVDSDGSVLGSGWRIDAIERVPTGGSHQGGEYDDGNYDDDYEDYAGYPIENIRVTPVPNDLFNYPLVTQSLPYPSASGFVSYGNNESANVGDSSFRYFQADWEGPLEIVVYHETEECCDALVVRDFQGNELLDELRSGTYTTFIPGNEFSIGIRSDGSVIGQGWRLEAVLVLE